MCCPAAYPTETGAEVIGNHFRPYGRGVVTVPGISEESLAEAASFGYGYAEKYNDIEVRLLEINAVVQRGTPAYGHLQFFQVKHS